MTDFFDWLTASDSGIGADRLADAFKLSHQELRKTTTALAPAFALALQRAMIVPGAWGEISRHYMPLMNDEPFDFTQGAMTSPVARDLASALFGSRDLVSSVARQVSVASGVTPDTVEMMIRNISVMTIGTMLRMMMANLTRGQPKELAEGNYHGAMAEMMRRSANAVEAMGRPSNEPPPRAMPQMPGSDYLSKLFGDALTGSIPWLPPETGQPAKATKPANKKPGTSDQAAFFDLYPALMEQFTRGLQSAASAGGDKGATQKQPAAASPPPSPAPEEKAGDDGTSQETLAEAAFAFQKDYAQRMMAIFTQPPNKPTPKDS